MANKNSPRGLKPHGRVLRMRPYVAGSTVYPGAALTLASDGQVDQATTGEFIGVAANYATVGQTVSVYDDPQQLFEVEADTAIATTDIGLNATLNAGTDSTAYKLSGMSLAASTIATTLTLSLQILAFVVQADNTANATYNDVIVRINAHQLQALGRIGV